jgi:methionine-rich copper-binding protein CopC
VLAAGEYVLKWRAVAKDGHVMKGEVAFTIAD